MDATHQPADPRRSNSSFLLWNAWIIFGALSACAVAFSSYFTSFLHAKEGVAALALGLLSMTWFGGRRIPEAGIRAFLPLWLFLLWCVVVHCVFHQAHVPLYAVQDLVRWATVLLIAAYGYCLCAHDVWRPRVTMALVVSALLVAVLGLAQYLELAPVLFPQYPGYDQQVYSVFGNQDLFGSYVAMAIPLVVYRAFQENGRPAPWLAALAVLVPALLISASRSAWLAAAVGLLCVIPYKNLTGIALKRAITVAALGAALVAATSILAPKPTFDRVLQSFGEDDVGWRARLWFWDATLRMAGDNPLLGVGVGNYQYWSPFYQGEALHAPGGERHYHNELHTLHAHSDPLELLAESGIVGVAFLIWMLVRVSRGRGGEWGGLAALLTVSLLNSLGQSVAHMLAVALLAGALLSDAGGRVVPREKGSRLWRDVYLAPLGSVLFLRVRPAKARSVASLLLLVVSIVLAAVVVAVVLVPSERLRAADKAHEAGLPAQFLYRRASDSLWPDGRAHLSVAVGHLDRGEIDAASEALSRAEKGLDTGDIHFLWGVVAAWRGDVLAARRAFEKCLWRWPSKPSGWEGLLRTLSEDEVGERRAQAEKWLNDDEIAYLFE